MNLLEFLKNRGVDAIDSGKDVRSGNIAFPCPFCGSADRGHHMSVRVEEPVGVWGCWRDKSHSGSGRNLRKLWKALGLNQRDIKDLEENFKVSGLSDAVRKLKSRPPAKELDMDLSEQPTDDAMEYLVDRWWDFILDKLDAYWLVEDYGICSVSTLPGRAVVPVFEDGVPVSYVARAIYPGAKLKYQTPHKGEAGRELKETLYNIDRKSNDQDILVVCEGVFDAISLEYNHERVHAVATLGTGYTPIQVDILNAMKREYDKVVVLFDEGAESQAMVLSYDIGANFMNCPEGDPEGKIFDELR